MDHNKLVAYNSKIQPFIFLLAAIILIPVCHMAVQDEEQHKIWIILFFSIIFAIMVFSFLFFMTLPRIAFEVDHRVLTIYRHSKRISNRLCDISKFEVNGKSLSFDAWIYHTHGRTGIHRVIKRKRRVCKQLFEILNRNRIATS